MTQRRNICIELGAKELVSLVSPIRRLITPRFRIKILLAPEANSMNYRDCELGLDDAIDQMQTGVLASILILWNEGSIRGHATVSAPEFPCTQRPFWYAMVESSFDRPLQIISAVWSSDLMFISVGHDDGLDLGELSEITYDNFPWGHPYLIEAAVTTFATQPPQVVRRQGTAALQYKHEP